MKFARAFLLVLVAVPLFADDGSAPAQPAPATDAATTERVGPHFRVVCDFASARAGDEALAAAEAVWPRCVEVFGAPKDVKEPLTVRLYRTEARYLTAEAKITQGRFAWNLAFAHRESKTAHVAVSPRIADGAIERAGLAVHTKRLIAHESVHLARFATTAQAGAHPGWLADGLALWIADETAREQEWIAAIDEDPTGAARLAAARRLLEDDTLPRPDDLLADRTDELEPLERYAVRFLFFRHLMGSTQGAALREAIRTLCRSADDGSRARFDAAVFQLLVGATWDALDHRFTAHLRRLPPRWTGSARELATGGTAWMQTADSEADAICWRLPAATPQRVEGTIELLPSDATQPAAQVLLAPGKTSCTAVSFVPGVGIRVERVTTEARTVVAETKSDLVATRRSVRFRIDVTGARLAVSLDGKAALEADVPALADGRGWALSARAGTTCLWGGVQFE